MRDRGVCQLSGDGEAPRGFGSSFGNILKFGFELYGVPYFLAESEAKQSGPRKEAVGARARSGRGFKCTGYPQLLWAEAESLQNSQCKPVNNCGGSHDFPELQFQIWKSGSRPQKAQPACYEWI